MRQPRTNGIAPQIGQLARSLWNELVAGDMRAGLIQTRGMSRAFRFLARFALALTVGVLLGLLLTDALRRQSTLQPLVFLTESLAGNYIPDLLLPVILGLLALAWTYLLCGALDVHWIARLVVLGLFVLFNATLVAGWIPNVYFVVGALLLFSPAFWLALLTIPATLVGWLLLVIVFVARRRWTRALGRRFGLILLAVMLLLFPAYYLNLWTRAILPEGDVIAIQFATLFELLNVLLLPFLIIAGAQIVETAVWLVDGFGRWLGLQPGLQRGAGTRLWLLALLAFLLVRGFTQWVAPLIAGQVLAFSLGALLCVPLFLLLGALFRRWTRDRAFDPTLAPWAIPAAALAPFGILLATLLVFVCLLVPAAVAILLGVDDPVLALFTRLQRLLTGAALWYLVLLGGLIALWGAFVAWRRRRAQQPVRGTSLFAMVLGVWVAWWALTRVSAISEALTFQYAELSATATLVLLPALLILLLARRLNPRRLLTLTAAALLFWLLQFPDSLGDPLNPLFDLLGVGTLFVPFAILLGVLAAGQHFRINAGSPRFPREARAFLFLGYALFTAVATLWLTAGHNTNALYANDEVTELGYLIVGLAFAFWWLLTQAVPGRLVQSRRLDQSDQASTH